MSYILLIMNIADLFYIVAIICMITITGMFVAIAVVVYRFISSVSLIREQVLYKLRNFKIAQYSAQLSILKVAMNLLNGFFKYRGGERR